MRVLLTAALIASACGPSEVFSGPDARADDVEAGADAAPDASSRADAAPTPDAGDSVDAAVAAYSHTIVIDGANDFSPDERLATSSASFDAFISWDDEFLFFAMKGPDVASADSRRFLLIYIGGDSGTIDGETYNTQQPVLPFPAEYHVRWKADNTFTSAKQFDGTDWVETGWDFAGDIFQSGDFVELRIARSDIDPGDTLDVHMSMVNEADMVEGTFAGTPALSFADGYDPDYAQYFAFDLSAPSPPGSYVPVP